MTSLPNFRLNTGYDMPAVGMGCWMGRPGPGLDNEIVGSLKEAFKAGYRHIDTAALYSNEREVGQAIRDSGVPRDEIFLTTKLSPWNFHDVAAAFDKSLGDLGVDYIDLYLVHWPMGRTKDGAAFGDEPSELGPTYNDVWAQMEKLLETRKGKVRSIGVSNFSPKTLNKLLKTAKIVPAANQIENHPYLPEEELVELCNEKGIVVTAYSPLGQVNSPLFEDPDLKAIAEAHNTTVGTICISWLVQRGVSAVPKSSNPDRMRQNLALVKLTDAEMERVINISRNDPKRSTRLLSGLVDDNKVMGWTLDQLGWDIGYNIHGVYVQPSYKDPAKSSGKGVPKVISDFVTHFYNLSDTPDVHEEYSQVYVDDPDRLFFQIGPMEATNTRDGVIAWRENGWKGVTRRKHVVNGIFISPENADAIMLDGSVEMDKEGKTVAFNWAGRMEFDHDSVERGQPLIESYKVWLSPA